MPSQQRLLTTMPRIKKKIYFRPNRCCFRRRKKRDNIFLLNQEQKPRSIKNAPFRHVQEYIAKYLKFRVILITRCLWIANQKKLAIIYTCRGLFCYNRLPFRISLPTAFFQRKIHNSVRHLWSPRCTPSQMFTISRNRRLSSGSAPCRGQAGR